MAYLAQNFADSFGEGLGLGLRAYQAGQENKRQNAEEARRAAEYEELQRQRAAEQQYRADLNELVQARRLGMPDYQATAAAASDRVQAGGENYDEPRFARGLTPTVRGEPLNNTEFTKRLADLQLGAGKMDAGQYLQTQEIARGSQARDIRDAAVKAYRANPNAVLDEWSQRFNPMESGIPIIVGQRDKDGYVTLGLVGEDNKGNTIKMSPAQQIKVAQGVALLDAGFADEAMELLNDVDERIGKLAMTFNQTQATLAGNANDVANARGLQDYRNRSLGIDEQRLKLARSNVPRQPREVDPQTLSKLNDLSAQIAAETDPAKKRALTNEWYRVNAIASTQLGRAMNPPQQNVEMTPLDKARLDAYYKAVAELPLDTPRAQVDALRARFGVEQFFGGGGLPGWGERKSDETNPPPPERQVSPPPRGQIYGPLTPRSMIEAAARAGDPNAIRYLEEQQQNAIDLEINRNDPNAYLGLR